MFERLAWFILCIAGGFGLMQTVRFTVVNEVTQGQLIVAGIVECMCAVAFLGGYLGTFMKRGN